MTNPTKPNQSNNHKDSHVEKNSGLDEKKDQTKKELKDNLEAADKKAQNAADDKKKAAGIDQKFIDQAAETEKKLLDQVKQLEEKLADKKEEKEKLQEKIEEVKAEKSPEKKKKGFFRRMFSNPNISYNPLSWARNLGKSAVSGVVTTYSRTVAKARHLVSRPQQIFTTKMRGDLGRNARRGVKNFGRAITGTIYKPHRQKIAYENTAQDYGEGRGPGSTNNILKLGARAFGKIPKFFYNMGQIIPHVVGDTFSGEFDYSRTKNAFKKTFKWNHKSNMGGKVVPLNADKQDKKAA